MASKSQAFSGKQVPFHYENEVCRQAYFIKSPPPQLFSSQPSWKSRYFVLSKNKENCYSLQYFKDHHCRGSIEVDQISSIEVGISDHEKMISIQKMFKCLPKEVMSIKTPKRDYYLIGKDWRIIEDWVSFISSSCLNPKVTHQNIKALEKMTKRDVKDFSRGDGSEKHDSLRYLSLQMGKRKKILYMIDKNLNLVNQDFRNKASAIQPLDSTGNQNIYQIIPEICDDDQEKHSSKDKRPVSDLGLSFNPPSLPEDNTCSRKSLPNMKELPLTRSHAVKVKLKTPDHLPQSQRKDDVLLKQYQIEENSSRLSQSLQMSDLAPETQQETEEEKYYLTPRSVLAQLDSVIASSEDKELNESKQPDKVVKPTDPLYMTMRCRFNEKKSQQPSDSKDEAQAFPENQAERFNLQGQEAGSEQCHSSRSEGPNTKNQRERSFSFSVVQLSRIINNIPPGSPLEEVDVFLSKNDINNYLTLTQVTGHICVAHWKGPPHLGCIFHHGDRLSAVNDLKLHTLEEVSLFLDRSLRKEVKLTICRIPDSDKFHTVPCVCT